MAKPSIFSKNYEKKMKQRRLKIIGAIVVIILIVGGIFYQVKLKNMSFNQIINSLQAWVNNDGQSNQDKQNDKSEDKGDSVTKKDEVTKPEVGDKIVESDFKVAKGVDLKVKIDEKGADKTFLEVLSKDYNTSISPNKKEIVLQDKNQNMYLLSIDGKVKNITKMDYVSRAGHKYPKDEMIEKEKKQGVDYKWGIEPKFIDDNNIVYKSNLPYFGASARDEYLWIYNIEKQTSQAVWHSKNSTIEITDKITNGGIKVKIGSSEYILTIEGKLLKE